MAQIGSFALLLALALSLYSFGVGLISLFFPGDPNWERLGETARRAGVVVFGFVFLAAVALVVAAFRDDFTIAYIFHHSNRDLPGPYKFATLWSGQEGSLLFWSLLLAGYGFVLRLRYKTDPRLFAYASVVLAGVQIFFLLLVNFAANPFGLLDGPLRADGSGLNPLLQYPEMVIHPPMLYLGYVGFTVPFAFALGALIMKYPGEKWIHITRRWTMVTWGFLTCGIFLGAHWAYAVLGWGGYWGWDPVENASLMPWLVGTAFLHSVMMQEKRGMLKVWNMWLVFATFWLAILGTFLTRSGIIASVHAFAQSSIGSWFAWFLAITFAVFLFFFIMNHDHLRSEHKLESLDLPRVEFPVQQSSFRAALLHRAMGNVVSENFRTRSGQQSHGRRAVLQSRRDPSRPAAPDPHRRRPLAGLAQDFLRQPEAQFHVARHRRSRRHDLPNDHARSLGIALRPAPLAGHRIFLFPDGHRPGALVTLTIASEYYRGSKVIAEPHRAGHVRLDGPAHPPQHPPLRRIHRPLRRRRRHHRIRRSAFNQEKEADKGMDYGDKMTIGDYTLVCRSYTQDDNPNKASEWAVIDVYKGGNKSTP